MSQATGHQSKSADQKSMALIEQDLAAVELILRQELQSDVDAVSEMLSHPLFWNGKRIRPILLLLSGHATSNGSLTSNHHLLAAVLEMIHAATLVHDDVLDDAEMRRHCPSINRGWGNQLSVLLGDFLFSHSFYLASTTHSAFACQQIGQATNAVCAGEILQITSQGNLQLSETEYFKIIDGKTARLCACACKLGVYASGAETETINVFEQVGLNYGRAFQIVDDVLDLKGYEATVGKSLGSDARQQKMTLPLIVSLDSASETDRCLWLDRLAKREFKTSELVKFIEDQRGFEHALTKAKTFVREAQVSLKFAVGDRAIHLHQLGDFIINRNL